MSIQNKLYDLEDELLKETNSVSRYDSEGKSIAERVEEIFQDTDIQHQIWDSYFDIGPSTEVGVTSISWIEDGQLNLYVIEWEE